MLEAVDVDVQRPRDGSRLAGTAREHLLRTVEHERAVGQPGEGIVQGLVGELACLLVHERQRTTTPRGEHEHEHPERGAQQHPRDQQHECV